MKTNRYVFLVGVICLQFTQAGIAVDASDRRCLASDIRDNDRIYLANTHSSGVVDSANARQNIADTANGNQAKRSAYGTAPGGSVWLDPRMLDCMDKLEGLYGFSYSVSEISGGSHTSGSYHYSGTAFDVYTINGIPVSASNPYWREFNQRCIAMGAIESLGPGDAGHDTHVHNAWGTGVGVNVAPPPGSPSCIGSVAGPDAVSWAQGRIDVVVRGAGNDIYHKIYDNGAWGGFNSIGGDSTTGPSICSWDVGRLDVFCRGADGNLMHRGYIQGTGWLDWQNMGGDLEASPDAVSWGSGRIDVVIRANGDNIQHRAFHNGAWDAWQNMGGGNVASAPAICSWASGRLDVFYRGTDNALWHQGYNSSGWLGWQNLGGNITGGPDAVSWGSGRIDLVVRGPGGDILHRAFHDGAWDVWQSLGGNSLSDPTISSVDAGSLDVFYAGTDKNLYRRRFINGSWQAWQNLGGNLQ